MNGISGPITRAKVEAFAARFVAKDPSTTAEVVHRGFNSDELSGGYAFLCDGRMLVYGFDGRSVLSLDPGDDASRVAKVEQFWRESRRRNRELELADVSPWHRIAIAALVSGLRSVADIPPAARPGVTDTARADALLVMLRRHVDEPSEASALRALARNDWLLEIPGEENRAHGCPVCGHPAIGRAWEFVSVCDDCYPKSTCGDGHHVVGHNIGAWGGFQARHADDRSICEQVSRTGVVWVEGRECKMGEAKFGGVFVGVADA